MKIRVLTPILSVCLVCLGVVEAQTGPLAVSVTPSSGSGSTQTFSFLYSDPNGFGDLPWVEMVFNVSLSAANSCYTHYDRPSNKVWLLNDATTVWLGPVTLGIAGTVENSQCIVTAGGSSSSKVGTNLTVNLALTFKPAFAGAKNVYLRTRDAGGLASSWQLRGTWTTTAVSAALWYADFETGSISQWYLPARGKQGDYGGDEERSGLAESVVSNERAHGGSRALKMTITAPPESGTRLFRWREPRNYPQLYYTVWYYFPQRYAVLNWWNVFQWKSKRSFSQVDPFFVLNVGNRPDGSMYFYLYNWQTRESFTQAVKDIPVGRWFSVSAFYACAGDQTGRVTFWQEDTPLFDLRQVRTRYPDGDCQWSVGNYAYGVNPSPATIFIDDAVISLLRP